VEGKGDQGNLKVLRLQNLHNGAAMLYNLLQVGRASGSDTDDFFNKIRATVVGLTTESIELCYFWATLEGDEVCFYGRVYDCWSLNNRSLALYREGRRCIRNACDWTLWNTHTWVEPRLQTLEVDPLGLLNVFTPPESHSDQVADKWKRRLERLDGSSKSRNRSTSSQRQPREFG